MRLLAAGACAAMLLAAQPCAEIEARIEAEAAQIAVVKDDIGAVRRIGEAALEGSGKCPGSPRLWYLAARSAEVLQGHAAGQAFAANGGVEKIAAEALAHAPSSPAVITLAARVNGKSGLARKALALDPAYQPARRALAELLAKEGSTEEALRMTASPRTPLMRLSRARILLAAKRPADSMREARRVDARAQPDEFSARGDVYRDTQEVLGFALLGAGKTAEGRKALTAAASAGSVAAQRYLSR